MNHENWTTANIPDLTGKVIIVTGGNSGLGYESVKVFASKGAEVILGSRSMGKGSIAKKSIGNVKGKIIVMPLDLMDLSSIRKFAEEYKSNYDRLDVLLNNAGIMTTPYGLTIDGFEGQMGTNHLGHFALTALLIDIIIKTPQSRIVNVSSLAHKKGKMDFNNFLFEGGNEYSPLKAYGRSKLANLLFTYELQRKLENAELSTVAVAAHPGVSKTNLVRYIENNWWYKLLAPIAEVFTQSAQQGALPQIRASIDHDVKGGTYYGPNGFREMKGNPVLVSSNSASHSLSDAKKLWEISEKLTGIKFMF